MSFQCPTISDLGAHIQWAKYESYNDSDGILPPNTTRYEVFEQLKTVTENYLTYYSSNSGDGAENGNYTIQFNLSSSNSHVYKFILLSI